MSKKNNEGAAVRSVSSETPTVDQERNTQISPKYNPKEKSSFFWDDNVNEGDVTPEEFEKRLQASKQVLADFANRMLHGATCQAIIAKDIFRELLLQNELRENNSKLPAEQIMADAKTIIHTGELLLHNYSEEHDHAVKVLGEIMNRHAPILQKAWSEWTKKEHSK